MPEDFDSILQTGSARFAEATRPPTAATLRGRAQRRHRQRAAGATAVVGVAAALAAMLSGGFGLRATPAPPATTPTTTTTPNGPPPVFAAGWDPVEQHAAFGWLPTWVTGVSYQSGAGDTEAAVATGQAGSGTPGPMWLTVSKQEPASTIHSGGGKAQKVSAPAVNGNPAFWIWTPIRSGTAPSADTVPGRAALEWQVGGAWVDLSGDTQGTGTLTAQQKDEQIRIAAGVTIGDKPLPLPLHIQDLPSGFPIAGGNMLHGSWAHSGAAWSLDLMFISAPDPQKQTTNLNIHIGPKDTKGAKDAQNNRDTVAPDLRSACKTDRGLQVCIDFTGPEPPALAASGGVQGLLDRITLLGPDPQYWTVHVIG
ncbi:hypothetical protein ABIA31_009098 [Catenulispora sp. MAP5-51]|uniref:hypothetical protein n=1 Tax=Catenulispora sp. MAP5-51 TaxID=3156298 RepID=UPI003513CA57